MIPGTERSTTLLEDLNAAQREAVQIVEGPALVVAGAGSGKTRVITHRIAYLLLQGAALSENILALTFTNKAAQEMKARVATLAGSEFRPPLISTFHAFGSIFLRRHIPLLEFTRNFVIYDEEDQIALLKDCCRQLNLPEARYNPRELHYFLKWQKSRIDNPEIFDPNMQQVFTLYSSKLRSSDAVDFEDLLLLPLKVLREFPDVLQRYREVYRFLMVDEYQDTNEIQFELLKMLAGERANLLVVGDEDQSIYKFRGARSENIQYFIRDFPHLKIVKLEQNYRSTKTIIKAAQAVISRNVSRIKKELWTENAAGEPVEVYHALDDWDEATFVTLRVMSALKDLSPDDIAVLYRANAQSRALEESFGKAQIPHRIVGSVGFYERREIKDAIAFLRLMVNRADTAGFLRVVNVPPRGVGKKMIEQIQAEAAGEQINLFESAKRTGGKALLHFLQLIENAPPLQPASAFLEQLLKEIGYAEYLHKDDSMSAQDRLENISEFLAHLRENEASPDFDLNTFLSELPLHSGNQESGEAVTLLTVHSAKGLEFRLLFVVGMEEGLFPHSRSMESAEDIAEERRLFYVAMTRAREKLHLTWAQRRGMFGSNTSNRPSRFLEEIPDWFKVTQISERFRAPFQEPAIRKASSEPASPYRVGSSVRHEKFGRGTVLAVEGVQSDWKVTIRFAGGVKTILTRYANLTQG